MQGCQICPCVIEIVVVAIEILVVIAIEIAVVIFIEIVVVAIEILVVIAIEIVVVIVIEIVIFIETVARGGLAGGHQESTPAVGKDSPAKQQVVA